LGKAKAHPIGSARYWYVVFCTRGWRQNNFPKSSCY